MKITIENNGDCFTFESDDKHKGIEDIYNAIYGLLVCYGFHPHTVTEVFLELSQAQYKTHTKDE